MVIINPNAWTCHPVSLPHAYFPLPRTHETLSAGMGSAAVAAVEMTPLLQDLETAMNRS